MAAGATALLPSTAIAADLPRRAAPPAFAPVPLFTWTGVYIGTHTAYTFTDRQRVTTRGTNLLTQSVIDAGFVPANVALREAKGPCRFRRRVRHQLSAHIGLGLRHRRRGRCRLD